jgi:ATP/maltotriose-dependent transcriptional regulator MalT/DNA-binding SARP family transcriptional activator
LTFFLRAKLLPPRPAPALLPRPRLTERLTANLARPVTLVTANAGSGKTTLVADFVRTHGRPCVWYQLDHTDADPLVFLGYITEGIRGLFPGFGATTLAYLRQAASELGQHPERAVDVLLNEALDRIEQQLILVLDDYHHLGADTAVHRVVDRLIAYLPDVMHLIIISRELPPLALARLRSQSSLAIIDRADLLFTDTEIQELFRHVFDLELTPEQLAEYRERTQGWITALQLIRQVAQRRALARDAGPAAGAQSDLNEVLQQSERDIFDYFAEEVYADEPFGTQQLLLRLALLERIDLETVRHLFPQSDCGAILTSLVRRNVFITVASDGRGEEYRLHPLFRDFLRRRLRSELGRAGVSAEYRRFADYFLARGQWEPAMRCLLAAEDFARAAAVIAEQGSGWISGGALALLVSFADAIPAADLESHPRALVHRAEVARLQGEYDTAQRLFRRAATLLHEQGDREGQAEAFHSLATIARRHGEYETAFAYLDRATALAAERSPVLIKCGNTRGLCFWALGEWTAAEREFRAALQLAEEQGDEHHIRFIAHNLGLPAMIRGDFGEALRWMRRMLREERGAPPVPQEAPAYLNMGRFYLYRGDLAECERHLERALERCQLFNLTALRGEIFEAYGNLYREQNDVARAREFYERAARAYDQAGIDPARRELWEEEALLCLQTGDLAGARARMDRLASARAALGDEMSAQTAALARGRVMIAQGEHETARRILEPALAYFRAHGLYYHEAQTCLALALCAGAAGHEGQQLDHLRRALDLAARFDYEYWLQREIASHPQLFAAAEAIELLPPDLREQLAAAASHSRQPPLARPAPPALQARTYDLTINMLGPVEIFRDIARPFAHDAWTTKRAREILCFIASRRYRRASKDTIIETFWGEADYETIEKNFHPTVSHIRKALNSNQPLKQNFLLYRDGDYLLNADFSYWIDTEEFDRLVAKGEAARRAGQPDLYTDCFEKAISLYRGEFMQGACDTWVLEQRQYYREQYLHMLEVLAATAQKEGNWPRSLQLAQQILQDDPFREDIHCLAMHAHAAQGNRVAVKEQYETLRRLLRKELGVEPTLETKKTYQRLIG